jgi:amino acid adenylation domain-containing protein
MEVKGSNTAIVAAQPPIDQPTPLTPAERKMVVEVFNDTGVPYPHDGLIHKLFESNAARTPGSAAVICGDQQLTYAQLNSKANHVARSLLALGVQPDDRVGLYASRGVETVIGMLGILKAGGAYVPLDISYPAERLAFLLADSAPVALLAPADLVEHVSVLEWPVIVLDQGPVQDCENPQVAGLSGRNAAYLIYTSGSTGKPKGVMIEHRSVLRLTINASYAPVLPGDCVAHCASPSFDATTWEIWAPLLNGARVLVVPQSIVLDPVSLNRTLVQHAVTVMFLTVGLFNEYVDALEEAFGGLRCLLTGGDALNPAIVGRVLAKSKPPRNLLNAYGPTETTTFATTFTIALVEEGASSVPIGKPISNTRIYILDEDRQPVAIGMTGEIYIGGPGVARGYLNQPELTAERFVVDPFADAHDARMYRSGDLGRWRADGNIEYLGRADFQVKIRGFRVEPGEVEMQLTAFSGVRQAVVIARKGIGGEKRLVAYLIAEEGTELSPILLRAYLASRLPDYMIPGAYVVLDRLPLTSNGKLDRAALPAPDQSALVSHEYEPPQGATEEILVGLWRDMLGVTRVGRHDDFFELGGNSLLGMKLITRAAATFGVQLPVLAVFQYPTILQMARLIEYGPPEALRQVSSDRTESGEGVI